MLGVKDKVEPFKATLDNGDTITIPEKGKKYILFFYPKDNTPGCTAEACNISENHDKLTAKGYEIYGISTDSVSSHQKFIEKKSLNIPLIADEDKKIVHQFGVWQLKKFMGKEYMGTVRTTFIIDETGHISHIIEKVKTKEASEQILETIQN